MLISTQNTENRLHGLFDSDSPVGFLPGGRACSPAWETPGLSLAHTSTQTQNIAAAEVGQFKLITSKGGSFCRMTQVIFPRPRGNLPVDGSPGRAIRGFSRSARLRMLEYINSIDQTRVKTTFFLSHTVKKDTLDWIGIERARRIWTERFRRKWSDDNATVIWKKEPHKSGTPHLHMLILWSKWAPDLNEYRKWSDDAWCESVATAGGNAAPAGQRVELMRLWQGVQSYCSKYCAKLINDEDGIPEKTGKIWGITFRKNIPIERDTEYFKKETGIRVKRALRRLQQRRSQRYEVRESDGKWFTVRQSQNKILGLVTVEQTLEFAKKAGLKVRKIKPKCMRNDRVPIWLEDEKGKMIHDGFEIHAFTSSVHFVKDSTIRALVDFTERALAHEEMLESRLPF
jgi:hypothetical protein